MKLSFWHVIRLPNCSILIPPDGLGVCFFAGSFAVCVLGEDSSFTQPLALLGQAYTENNNAFIYWVQ
jgi:hypothetical protein